MLYQRAKKNRYFESIVLAVWLALFAMKLHAAEGERKSFTDMLGTRMELPQTPQRVVTLIPSLGELAADLLEKDLPRLVGVSEYSTYPPALKNISSVGSYARINVERVVALRPDLVLASKDGNSKDQVEQLREFKIPVVVVKTDSFEQVENSMRMVGQALGLSEKGAKMAEQFRRGLHAIREKAVHLSEKGPPPKVLIQISDTPLVVAGGGTLLNQSVEWVGGKNIYSDTSVHYPRPSVEDAIQRAPELILILSLGGLDSPDYIFQKMRRNWIAFRSLPAVQRQQIYLFEGDSLLRPTLRMLEGLSLLSKKVHQVAQKQKNAGTT